MEHFVLALLGVATALLLLYWGASDEIMTSVEYAVASFLYPAKKGGVKLEASTGLTVSHALWTSVLKRHVSKATVNGIRTNVVDYAGLASDPDYQRYRRVLAGLGDLEQLTIGDRLATLINAYNAFCIGLVVDYIREGHDVAALISINDLAPSPLTAVWKVPAGSLGGRMHTLNELEHQFLRGQFDVPRIHACIVCASVSCPDLRPEAYEAANLEAQMEDQMRLWLLNDKKGLSVVHTQGKVTVSRIFNWFKADFGPLKDFLGPYIDPHTAGLLRRSTAIDYFAYDWGLNDVSRARQ